MANPNFIPSFSTNEVFRDLDNTRCLTDDLDAIEAGLADKAPSDHIHTGYAPSGHTHSEYAPANHTHTGYAEEGHTHSEYAPANHEHSGYAPSSHSHSGYAPSSHNHDSDYLSIDGGAIDGDVNVKGVIRVNGQQAFYYNGTTNSQTIGTNNATGGTTIGCNADANTTINGKNVKTKNAIPQASNSYELGSSSFRWKNIYTNNAVNVASDKRLKRDIASMDTASLAAFVNKLSVVSYNYNDDPAEAKSRIGLLAQEVQSANAELAKFFVEEDENGMLGMTPANLVFALIATVQEQQRQINELKAAR